MRRALIFISLRNWRDHKLRAVVTLVGVAIGVSTYFALRSVNQSLMHSLAATVDKLAGKATLQITAGESGFTEDVLKIARSTAGVSDAAGQILQFCKTDLKEQGGLLILGVDPEDEQKLRGYDVDASTSGRGNIPGNPVEFLRIPGTVVISSELAEKERLKAGDSLPVFTSRGRIELKILYVLKDERVGSLYGGRIGIMDIHAAQNAFGRGRNIDRIDLITEPGVEVDSVRQRLKEQVAAGLEVERPQQRSQRVEDATIMIRQGFLVTSLIALLISSFLIFNAMSIAVNQRWREIGILRALGVERHNVARMFLYDASLIGLLGSGLGVIVGYYMALIFGRVAGGLMPVVSAAMPSSMLWLVSAPESPRFNTGFAVESVALGVAASLISAWLPARAASRLNPILALHNIEKRQREAVIGWPRMALGISLVTAGLALVRFTTPRVGVIFQLSYFVFIFLGLIIMLPKLSCWIATAIRPVADRVFGSEGVLAVDSIILAPRRTSATVGALMVGLAFVFSIWGFIQSEKQVLMRSFERNIGADLQVRGAFFITEDIAEPLASIPGIKNIDRAVFTTTRYRDSMVALIASDMALWFARSGNSLSTGDIQYARELVPKGEGVLVSDVFAARSGISAGDILSLETPSARLERPVLGIIDSKAIAWLEGVVCLDRQLYKEYWKDNRISWLSIDLEPDADPVSVAREIERVTSPGPPIFVESSAETIRRGKEIVARNIEQFFTFFYVQMFIVTFVAVIGIINTMVISVWDRRREIGIIRAVGGTRAQIRKMVLLEAAAISIVGLITGVAKGVFDSYFMSQTAAGIFGGYSIPFYMPVVLVASSVPIIAIIALAASWWPARLAARTNVVAAIGSE